MVAMDAAMAAVEVQQPAPPAQCFLPILPAQLVLMVEDPDEDKDE